ncbi:MAG: hypothetical protein OXH93_19565 [Caldilineaceae bacterium]|nr:hypothetical protein [Caldilineaceae bacterium]
MSVGRGLDRFESKTTALVGIQAANTRTIRGVRAELEIFLRLPTSGESGPNAALSELSNPALLTRARAAMPREEAPHRRMPGTRTKPAPDTRTAQDERGARRPFSGQYHVEMNLVFTGQLANHLAAFEHFQRNLELAGRTALLPADPVPVPVGPT